MKNPLSYVSEEYRKLCTRIFSVTEKNEQNIIVVTSSAMGEGKSLTSVNLATVIASKIDHTVLIVDCDLRNPTIHKYFGLNPKVGLVDYLKGTIKLEDALINTGIGRMTFLPAGIPPDNPVELLSSNKMTQLIKDIKSRYKNRYIIIDSTPVLTTAESIAIAAQADGVVFVVRERMVPKKEVKHALSLLKGANLLGVVLNGDEDRTDSYYKRSYYTSATGK
jgi:exopolysaccharide/PEP-CTERM locus tyrosine autokinase